MGTALDTDRRQGQGTRRLIRAVHELALVRPPETVEHIAFHAARDLIGCDGAEIRLRGCAPSPAIENVSRVVVPLCALEMAGVLEVYWLRDHDPSDDELRLIEGLADAIAVALECEPPIRNYA